MVTQLECRRFLQYKGPETFEQCQLGRLISRRYGAHSAQQIEIFCLPEWRQALVAGMLTVAQ